MGPSTPFTEVDDFLFGRFYPELATNQSHVADAELTKMLVAQRREMDPKKRKQIVDDIQRYLADKAYYVYVPQLAAVRRPSALREGLPATTTATARACASSIRGSTSDRSMKRYILRRVGLAIPTLFLVSVIVFAMMRLMPGDVATRMVEGHAYAPTLGGAAGRTSASTGPSTSSTRTGSAASCCAATSATRTGRASRSGTSSCGASR